jgi:alpha-1,2-mannosyltransferase
MVFAWYSEVPFACKSEIELRSLRMDPEAPHSDWYSIPCCSYYDLFASIYGFMGQYSRLTMVNSNWTKNHIDLLWGRETTHLIYPPCDTKGLQQLPMDNKNRRELVSIAQFRPEKNHLLQIEIMEELIHNSKPAHKYDDVVLYMIGSLRVGNEADEALVERLKSEIQNRGLEKNVFVLTGVSNAVLKQHYTSASIGLHTMSQEHFGIGVVELQASGIVPIANDSAGPKLDIVAVGTGKLACDVMEYKDALVELLDMQQNQFETLAANARTNAKRFSDEVFIKEITKCYQTMPDLYRAVTY